jgi:dihydroorotase
MTAQITLIRPDDWHLHVRDGEILPDVLTHTAKQFGRAVIMPNLRPPVTTVELAQQYKARIQSALQSITKEVAQAQNFQPLMTLYLTDVTKPEEIDRAVEAGIVGFKLYPAGATTNSDAGVTDLKHCTAVLERMQEKNMPLLVHGEVTSSNIDLFDREAVFIDRVLEPLRKNFPALKVVFEHITTKQAAQYVRDADTQRQGKIGATLTAHHLLFNRNAIFIGGIRPHYYCLPVLKREEHRIALLEAATSDSDRFFLGTDSAPHPKHLKEHACGCAGCYTSSHAMELYAQAFDLAHQLDRLEAFSSLRGPDFYGLPRNTSTITLQKTPQEIPLEYALGNDVVVPLNAGETLAWTFVG